LQQCTKIIIKKKIIGKFHHTIKHITAVSTRNATSKKIKPHKFHRRPKTGALRLVIK
jgi:hypothetical protein